jgi:hypothetical protein
MPIPTARDTPRYDATVQRSDKNVFDRDPLVIPQLFVDHRLPWYRRVAPLVLAIVSVLVLIGFAALVYRFGLAGTAIRLGRVGGAVMRGFARVVAG